MPERDLDRAKVGISDRVLVFSSPNYRLADHTAGTPRDPSSTAIGAFTCAYSPKFPAVWTTQSGDLLSSDAICSNRSTALEPMEFDEESEIESVVRA